ncbi:hypothetical protein D1BOALGB6SA_4802 [Olavius sp. associated proteobacterium Delta 1]|nr:hypothetical protein D1BOALGB6SA_4802 [Olavius sp. associated proteobacterium Delta 1]
MSSLIIQMNSSVPSEISHHLAKAHPITEPVKQGVAGP